jgi:uncharacterized protein
MGGHRLNNLTLLTKINMRLQASQVQVIQSVVQQIAGQQTKIWLYGSRLDDSSRGGDVDLLVQVTPPISLMRRAKIKTQLERELGLPVDILACGDESQLLPFAQIAMYQGIRL